MAHQDRNSLKKTIHIIEVCLRDIDYLTALYSIFGISTDEISAHLSLRESMLESRNKLQRINMIEKRRGTWEDFDSTKANDFLSAHLQVYKTIREIKELLDNSPPKVLCSEKALVDLASKIRKEGSVIFHKNDLAKFFDFSEVFPLWHQVPDYTLFVIGSGIFLSSPEFDLFDAMCWFHDEAVRTRLELFQYKDKVGTSEFKEEVYSKLFAIDHINCRQALINAFLLVEAFLNSLATVCLDDKSRRLTEEDRLSLSEKAKEKSGNYRQKFVSIQNKLHDWVRIISPHGKTFDKGKEPFQSFIKIQEYRDSLVHLSSTKVSKYRSINFDVAEMSVHTSVEIVKRISEYTSPNLNIPQYPFWLTEIKEDGLFHVSRTFDFTKRVEEKIIKLQDATLSGGNYV